MRITKLTLEGYRRFAVRTKLLIRTRLFCLLGPNESGKTSVLNALALLSSDAAFADVDLSHGMDVASDAVMLEAEFDLDEDDRLAIAAVAAHCKTTRLNVKKLRKGHRDFQIDRVTRDPSSVERLKERLADPDVALERRTAIEKLLVPDEATGDLTAGSISKLKAARKHGQDVADPLDAAIDDVLLCYTQEHPRNLVTQVLRERFPRFVFFSDADRNLPTAYNFVPPPGSAPSPVPKALANLAAVAGLDMLQLSGDVGSAVKIRNREYEANDALTKALSDKWSQSALLVAFRVHPPLLEIHVQESSRRYTSLGERSDGLRQFVALLAMLHSQGSSKSGTTVLLVDEAERHLHYDAQADLIRVFLAQSIVRQIIYTTHSAGCLPNDLGTGVGGVVPDESSRSHIVNNLWDTHSPSCEPGIRPMLVALGASALAFVPLRSAVFVEGPADAVLLPALLRRASGREEAGFQIVPGLSIASRAQAGLLKGQAPSVAHVVDGDAGGASLRKRLIEDGVEDRFVKMLPFADIEAVVDVSAYVRAVRVCEPALQIEVEDLSGCENRSRTVERICALQGLRSPSKVTVAYELLSNIDSMPLSHDASAKLNQLHEELCKVLEIWL